MGDIMARLTNREREVAMLLAAGQQPRDIARRLVISRYTVYNHIKAARVKLGAPSLLDLAVRIAADQSTTK